MSSSHDAEKSLWGLPVVKSNDTALFPAHVPIVAGWNSTFTIQVQIPISGSFAVTLSTDDATAQKAEQMIIERATEHVCAVTGLIGFAKRGPLRKYLAIKTSERELRQVTFHASPASSPSIATTYSVIEPMSGQRFDVTQFSEANPLILCAFVVFDVTMSAPTLTPET